MRIRVQSAICIFLQFVFRYYVEKIRVLFRTYCMYHSTYRIVSYQYVLFDGTGLSAQKETTVLPVFLDSPLSEMRTVDFKKICTFEKDRHVLYCTVHRTVSAFQKDRRYIPYIPYEKIPRFRKIRIGFSLLGKVKADGTFFQQFQSF